MLAGESAMAAENVLGASISVDEHVSFCSKRSGRNREQPSTTHRPRPPMPQAPGMG
jgi:hypothetical protein